MKVSSATEEAMISFRHIRFSQFLSMIGRQVQWCGNACQEDQPHRSNTRRKHLWRPHVGRNSGVLELNVSNILEPTKVTVSNVLYCLSFLILLIHFRGYLSGDDPPQRNAPHHDRGYLSRERNDLRERITFSWENFLFGELCLFRGSLAIPLDDPSLDGISLLRGSLPQPEG